MNQEPFADDSAETAILRLLRKGDLRPTQLQDRLIRRFNQLEVSRAMLELLCFQHIAWKPGRTLTLRQKALTDGSRASTPTEGVEK